MCAATKYHAYAHAAGKHTHVCVAVRDRDADKETVCVLEGVCDLVDDRDMDAVVLGSVGLTVLEMVDAGVPADDPVPVLL